MKKILFYTTGGQGSQEGGQLEEAIDQYNLGNEIFFLSCDDTIGGCLDNPLCNRLVCKVCTQRQKEYINTYLPKGVRHYWAREFANIATQRPEIPHYESLRDLRNLTFHNVDIGMGAISSYISLTRNLTPLLNSETKVYINKLLEQQISLILIIEFLLNQHQFEMFVFHNGRFAQYKPLLNIAQDRGIDFICTEFIAPQARIYKCYYHNDIPHSAVANTLKYNQHWDAAADDIIQREKIARSFFENKRNAQRAGDVVYTKNQTIGLLPDSWDRSKENIVIFNSSEDEYCAVSREFDEMSFFESQLIGCKEIVEHYKDDTSKHFYLRVHPNLISVKYKYHVDIYKMKYSNLTVIPADSPISTYSLMDAADKVIVFGSTAGVESVYWGKPTICLAGARYYQLGIVYIPRNYEELWGLIENRCLPCLYNVNVLKFGFFYMSEEHPQFKHINNAWVEYKLLGKSYRVLGYQKILGSNFLYMLINAIYRRTIYKPIWGTSLFKKVPCVESSNKY